MPNPPQARVRIVTPTTSPDTGAAQAAAAFAEFSARFPGYAATARLDELRAREYHRIDDTGSLYLDWAGAGLFADVQLRQHAELLRGSVLGNPQAESPSSLASSELVERVRAQVLATFHASPDEYTVVFTANASAACKLVGEAFPFAPRSHLLLSADNHNSVNGIREFARARGAAHSYVPLNGELRIASEPLGAALERFGTRTSAARSGWRNAWRAPRRESPRLFAYPAQSNFSGVQHPLEWIEEAQKNGWHVLLDAAAFVATNRLDIGRWQPDFVTLSFYKMMGYPTGLGCLIARREALAQLRRPWFSSGSVLDATVLGDAHRMAEDEAGFEDGTPDYLSIPAVGFGLDHLARIGMDVIHTRVEQLTDWLLGALSDLAHDNGKPLARIYGPCSTEGRGGTVAFNLLDDKGEVIDQRWIEQLAIDHQITLRTGWFCNPGAAERVCQIEARATAWMFAPDKTMNLDPSLDPAPPARTGNLGAIRISLGLASTFADVHRFVAIVAQQLGATAA